MGCEEKEHSDDPPLSEVFCLRASPFVSLEARDQGAEAALQRLVVFSQLHMCPGWSQ